MEPMYRDGWDLRRKERLANLAERCESRNDICAIMEWSLPPVDTTGHHSVRIYGRDADTWTIRMAYVN